METLNEVNELLTAKMCSPVIVYGVILVLSLMCIYWVRQKLSHYNTLKMENLYNLYSAQELKFLLILGVTMYGLCQYNKTELAWVFLIFPIIYVVLQNVLLYVHVSSALQNAPVDPGVQAQQYGAGMKAPLLGTGPSPPQITTPETPPATPPPPQQATTWELPKISNAASSPMSGSFGGAGAGDVQGFNL